MGKNPRRTAAERLIKALERQDTRCIQKVISSGEISLNTWLLDLGVTALHLAVGHGSEGFAACITHDMLKYGADPNSVSTDGMTPVHVAAAWGRPTVLRLLLLHGGDPWRLDEECKNAFSYAFESKAWATLAVLHDLHKPISRLESEINEETFLLDGELNDSRNSSFKGEDTPLGNNPSIDKKTVFTFITTHTHYVNNDLKQDSFAEITPKKISESLQCTSDEIECNRGINLPAEVSEAENSPELKTENLNTPEDRRRNYTVRKLAPKNENPRAALFEELTAAVNQRAFRISGVETLPSLNSTSRFSGDFNTAICESLSDLEIRNNREKSFTNPSRTAPNDCESVTAPEPPPPPPKMIEDDHNLHLALVTESRFSEGEANTSYQSLSEADTSGSFASCEDPCSPVKSNYDDETIRNELIARGVNPGPITPSTRGVYLRLLTRLKRNNPPKTLSSPLPSPSLISSSPNQFPSIFSPELENALQQPFSHMYAHLENDLRNEYDGLSKPRTCFNYLLLDGRITRDLPNRALSMPATEVMSQFLAALFYIGKGQNSRPLEHLREAKLVFLNREEGRSPKEAKILDAWRAGSGVVCVRVFQDISSEEALTREAAMIAAMRRQNLCNLQPGQFYGRTSTWIPENKRKLGAHLLITAKDVFLQSSERSLLPKDLP